MKKKNIQEWAKDIGHQILDPDGFDRRQPDVMTRLVTQEEFNAGFYLCTVRSIPPLATSTPATMKIEQGHVIECDYCNDTEISYELSENNAIHEFAKKGWLIERSKSGGEKTFCKTCWGKMPALKETP